MASQAGSTGSVSTRQAAGASRSRMRIWLDRIGYVVLALLGVAGLAFALYQLYMPKQLVQVERTTIDTIPVTVFRPDGDPGPAVVIAHGFSGSHQLMYPFGLTLARNGYTAVMFDFPGHGQNVVPLQGDSFGSEVRTTQLVETIDQVVAFARERSNGSVGLLGHSMGSEAVIRYAQLHADEVAAVVAVSLVYDGVTPTSPPNLLVLTGAMELSLRPLALNVADQSVMGGLGEPNATYGEFAQGTARRVVLVPWVGHIGVLYSPVSMDETLRWFNQMSDLTPLASPYLDNRAPWMGLLFLSMLMLFWPFALLLQPIRRPADEADLQTFTWVWWAALALVPALLTPVILWGIRRYVGVSLVDNLLPIEVGGPLTLLFAIYGLLTALGLWFWSLVRRRRVGKRVPVETQHAAPLHLPLDPDPEPVLEWHPEPEPEPVLEWHPEPEPEPVLEWHPEPEPVLDLALPVVATESGSADIHDVDAVQTDVAAEQTYDRRRRRGRVMVYTRPVSISQVVLRRRAYSTQERIRSQALSSPTGLPAVRVFDRSVRQVRPASLPVPIVRFRTHTPAHAQHPAILPGLVGTMVADVAEQQQSPQDESLPAVVYAGYTTIQMPDETAAVEVPHISAPTGTPAAMKPPAETKPAKQAAKQKRPQPQRDTPNLFRRVLVTLAIALLVVGFVFLLSGIPAHLFMINFFPPVERLWIAAVVFVAMVPYFLADEAFTRGPQRPPWMYGVTKACFILAIILSIAVNAALSFLLFIAPLFIGYFILYGFFSWRVYQRTGSIVPGALANAVFFAWIVAVTFPLV